MVRLALNRSNPKRKEPFLEIHAPCKRERFSTKIHIEWVIFISELRHKFNDYMNIVGHTIHYEFESGNTLEFQFHKNNFPHMIGLHKLLDIPLIQRFNNPKDKMAGANYIISKIKKGDFTETDVKSSLYYEAIQKRYNQFTANNLFSMTYTDAIVNFDVSKLPNSKLQNTQYILYETEPDGYRNLCVGHDKSEKYYVETFFYEPSDYYIRGQLHEKIVRMHIIAPDNSIYFEDTF